MVVLTIATLGAAGYQYYSALDARKAEAFVANLFERSIVPTLSHTGVPNAYLQDMVARGDVGIRSGRGFYDWRNRDGAATQRRASDRLQRLLAYLEKDAAE